MDDYTIKDGPFTLNTDPPAGDIVFYQGNEEVLKITKDDNKNTIFKWGSGSSYLEWNKLENYLKDLLSTDLSEAVIRELKIKMENEVKQVCKKAGWLKSNN